MRPVFRVAGRGGRMPGSLWVPLELGPVDWATADVGDVLEPHSDHRRPFRPPRDVLVEHDDGRWYVGSQFEWVRWPTGEWRAGVTYTTEPGSKFVRSVPAERTRLPATRQAILTGA
jgi:hypothetical protein